MKREHNEHLQQEDYLFRYDLSYDGRNSGNMDESQYFSDMFKYGSNTTTPNFSDNLVFTELVGTPCYHVGQLSEKLVAMIDTQNFNLNEWMNDNDFEFGIDLNGNGQYVEYGTSFALCRNNQNTKSSGLTGKIQSNESDVCIFNNEVMKIRNVFSLPLNHWIRITLKKIGTSLSINVKNIISGAVIASGTYTWVILNESYPTHSVCILGDYFPNANYSHNVRVTIGYAKNLYMKKL